MMLKEAQEAHNAEISAQMQDWHKKWSTRELGGTLLCYNDDADFEMSRAGGDTIISSHINGEVSQEDIELAEIAYKESSCWAR